MAVIDLTSYKTFAGLPLTTTPLDGQYTALCAAVDADVKNFCKRLLETQTITEYRDGSNVPTLALYQRPVQFFLYTGTLTVNSPTVSALSSTTGLLVGMPVTVQTATGAPAIPVGTTIQSIGSGTVTLSQNATANASATPLVFGLAVYLDSGGYYGQGIGGFETLSQLFLGNDYVIRNDQPNGTSKSGVLMRLGGGPTAGVNSWPWGWQQRQGTLTARLAPTWVNWYGNVLINYTAGLGVGSSLTGGTLPADLSLAAALLVSAIARQIKVGGQIASESLGAYSYSIHYPTAGEPAELGTARQILGRYRELAL